MELSAVRSWREAAVSDGARIKQLELINFDHETGFHAATTEIDTLPARVQALEEALKQIAEYWNGNENERAMADACHHVVEVAQQALTPAREIQHP